MTPHLVAQRELTKARRRVKEWRRQGKDPVSTLTLFSDFSDTLIQRVADESPEPEPYATYLASYRLHVRRTRPQIYA